MKQLTLRIHLSLHHVQWQWCSYKLISQKILHDSRQCMQEIIGQNTSSQSKHHHGDESNSYIEYGAILQYSATKVFSVWYSKNSPQVSIAWSYDACSAYCQGCGLRLRLNSKFVFWPISLNLLCVYMYANDLLMTTTWYCSLDIQTSSPKPHSFAITSHSFSFIYIYISQFSLERDEPKPTGSTLWKTVTYSKGYINWAITIWSTWCHTNYNMVPLDVNVPASLVSVQMKRAMYISTFQRDNQSSCEWVQAWSAERGRRHGWEAFHTREQKRRIILVAQLKLSNALFSHRSKHIKTTNDCQSVKYYSIASCIHTPCSEKKHPLIFFFHISMCDV